MEIINNSEMNINKDDITTCSHEPSKEENNSLKSIEHIGINNSNNPDLKKYSVTKLTIVKSGKIIPSISQYIEKIRMAEYMLDKLCDDCQIDYEECRYIIKNMSLPDIVKYLNDPNKCYAIRYYRYIENYQAGLADLLSNKKEIFNIKDTCVYVPKGKQAGIWYMYDEETSLWNLHRDSKGLWQYVSELLRPMIKNVIDYVNNYHKLMECWNKEYKDDDRIRFEHIVKVELAKQKIQMINCLHALNIVNDASKTKGLFDHMISRFSDISFEEKINKLDDFLPILPYYVIEHDACLIDVETKKPIMMPAVINLRTSECIRRTREHYFTVQCNIKFDPYADDKFINDYINAIMLDDLELIKALQLLAGCSLTGRVLRFFIILINALGNNGKSVFVRLLTDILGYFGTPAGEEVFIKKGRASKGGPDPFIADLDGRRLVSMSEVEDNDEFNNKLMKGLTGRDKLKTRGLHQDPFTLEAICKLWLACNKLPKASTEKSFWDRTIIIPFNADFVDNPQPGTNQRKKIDFIEDIINRPENISAFFNWLLVGAKRFYQEGVKPETFPPIIRDAKQYYKIHNNPTYEFYSKCVEKYNPDDQTHVVNRKSFELNAGAVFKAYVYWFNNKYPGDKPLANNQFPLHFDILGHDLGFVKSSRTHNKYFYSPIRIKPEKEGLTNKSPFI